MKLQKYKIKNLYDNNLAPLAANNILFPALDRRRYIPLDIAGHEEIRRVDVHPECVFIATANVGSEYAGTQSLDRALVDRFFPVEMSYPSKDDEKRVIKNRVGIDAKTAENIVTVANKIRDQYNEQELSSTISVRHTLQVAELVKDGLNLGEALNSVVLPLFENGIGASERSKVKTIIAAY